MGGRGQTGGVWRHGLPGDRTAARWPARRRARWPARRPAWRRPLEARLAAAVLCLVAAGAAAITAASHLVARHTLTRQADQQLHAYAGLLAGRPFTIFPDSRLVPGASGAGGAGRMLSIEVRASGGQVLISAGPVTPPAGGRAWLTTAEPIRYQAHHIPFVFGAEDSALSVTGAAGPGLAGTLHIGLDLASTDQAVDRLTITCLAVSGVVLLLVTCAAAGMIRVLMRPLARMAQAAEAVAAGELSRRMPARRAQSDVGRLGCSLNRRLSQTEHALSAAAASEATARESSERMRRTVADAGRDLRRPLSVLAGLAEYYRERGELGNEDLDRLMRQLTDQAARMDLLVDDLLPSAGTSSDRGAAPAGCGSAPAPIPPGGGV
jgi:two-component system, OmpR family, sensor kinase